MQFLSYRKTQSIWGGNIWSLKFLMRAKENSKKWFDTSIKYTFHFGFPSVSWETSSMNDANSLNIISHTSRCEWPRAIVAACWKHREIISSENEIKNCMHIEVTTLESYMFVSVIKLLLKINGVHNVVIVYILISKVHQLERHATC